MTNEIIFIINVFFGGDFLFIIFLILGKQNETNLALVDL